MISRHLFLKLSLYIQRYVQRDSLRVVVFFSSFLENVQCIFYCLKMFSFGPFKYNFMEDMHCRQDLGNLVQVI